MFATGDDYYYITYTSMILLSVMKRNKPEKQFRDIRKLSFLIDFVSSERLVNIVERYQNRDLVHSEMNTEDRELLVNSYANGLLRQQHVLKLLFALDNREIVSIKKSEDKEVINIWLNEDNFSKDFLKLDVFKKEKENAKKITKLVQRISVLNLDTLLEGLYENYGIKTWQDYA